MGVLLSNLANHFVPALASVYNGSNYNGSTYNGNAQTSTNTSSGGILTNTGFDITAIATIACLIILIAVIVRIWKRQKRTIDFSS